MLFTLVQSVRFGTEEVMHEGLCCRSNFRIVFFLKAIFKILAPLVWFRLYVAYYSGKEACVFLHFFLCSAEEVKVPVEMPVEVCLLLPVLRFDVLLITKTT